MDLIVGEKAVINHLIKKYYSHEIENISIIKPVLKIRKLYIGVSKKNTKHKKIINKFNKALKELRKNGIYNNILKKHDM